MRRAPDKMNNRASLRIAPHRRHTAGRAIFARERVYDLTIFARSKAGVAKWHTQRT